MNKNQLFEGHRLSFFMHSSIKDVEVCFKEKGKKDVEAQTVFSFNDLTFCAVDIYECENTHDITGPKLVGILVGFDDLQQANVSDEPDTIFKAIENLTPINETEGDKFDVIESPAGDIPILVWVNRYNGKKYVYFLMKNIRNIYNVPEKLILSSVDSSIPPDSDNDKENDEGESKSIATN